MSDTVNLDRLRELLGTQSPRGLRVILKHAYHDMIVDREKYEDVLRRVQFNRSGPPLAATLGRGVEWSREKTAAKARERIEELDRRLELVEEAIAVFMAIEDASWYDGMAEYFSQAYGDSETKKRR